MLRSMLLTGDGAAGFYNDESPIPHFNALSIWSFGESARSPKPSKSRLFIFRTSHISYLFQKNIIGTPVLFKTLHSGWFLPCLVMVIVHLHPDVQATWGAYLDFKHCYPDFPVLVYMRHQAVTSLKKQLSTHWGQSAVRLKSAISRQAATFYACINYDILNSIDSFQKF